MAVNVERSTALSAALTQKLKIGNSTVNQKIIITENSKLIRIENQVDWQEVHKMLRVSAEVQLQSENATYEIQFGNLKRPTHSNTSWDAGARPGPLIFWPISRCPFMSAVCPIWWRWKEIN